MKYAFIALFFALAANAGVRSVGKGGGYAEMQAYLANLRMGALTQFCQRESNICDLSMVEAAAIGAASVAGFELTLNPGCEGPGIEVISSRHAKVSACELYHPSAPDVSPRVKDFSEIAATVLAARLMAINLDDPVKAHHLAGKVFRRTLQSEQALGIQLGSGSFVFHILTIDSLGHRHSIFSLEGRQVTLDVTKPMFAALGCEPASKSPPAFQIRSASAVGLNEAMVEVQSHWTCADGATWQGRLQIFFLTEDGEIKESSLRARVVGRHRL